MSALRAAEVPPRSGAPYQLDRDAMEVAGRRRSVLRTLGLFLVLLLVQQPLRRVAAGTWWSVHDIPTQVPLRLSLLVDLTMVVVYVVLAVRLHELARSRPAGSTTRRGDGLLALGLVLVGAVLDVVEDAILWRRAADAGIGAEVEFTLGWSWAMQALVVVGLLLGLVAAEWVAQGPHVASRPAVTGSSAPPSEPERPGLVVACSGGGIRAASFCLGGLQALQRHHRTPDAVVGVSGGGYMAAAHHVLRWCSSDGGSETWADLRPAAYAPDSAEEKWLRRHSRYLLDSTRAGVIALLSLLFGIAVNLLFVMVGLGAAAWLTAWFLLASGGITAWPAGSTAPLDPADPFLVARLESFATPTAWGYRADWAWAGQSWVVLVVGVGLFVLAKTLDRFSPFFDVVGRERVRTFVARTVLVGVGLVVALLGLPLLLVALHDFAAADHGGDTLTGALASLLTVLGFSEAGSGRAVSTASLATVALAVLATVRAVGSTVTGSGNGASSGVGKIVGKLWTLVKAVVLPWLATVVVVLLLVTVFLTWTTGLLNHPDDLARWDLAFWFGGLLVAVLLLTDANRTSLHHFYRERLSSAYLVRRGPRGRPEPIDYTRALRFSDSAPPPRRGPELVICAVANVNDADVVPTDRGCTPFVFSHERIGLSEEILPEAGMVRSDVYEFAADSRGRDATIPAAMAISGAAFSPLAGRENVILAPFRFVLALANARLGVWLPNPLWLDQTRLEGRQDRARKRFGWRWWLEVVRSQVTKPTPLLVAREAFGRTSVLDRFLYVTDGGHYDNLGLVEALRRRPRQVVVLDASNDPEDTFRALGRAIATARMDLGCDLRIDPRAMRRLQEGRAQAGWVRGTVTYRADADGWRATGEVWIAKAVMLDDLPWDLETYRADHPDFPRSSTSDQLYGEFDLEAYRALGHDVVRRLVPELDRPNTPPQSPVGPLRPR